MTVIWRGISRPKGVVSLLVVSAALVAGYCGRNSDETVAQEPAKVTNATAASGATKSEPRYDGKGDLLLPEGFETWVFVGANLGVEYGDGAKPPSSKKGAAKPSDPANFHNVYINPEAFDAYRRTGKFPEKTVFILDIYSADEGEPGSIVSEGRFPGKPVSVAVAVKNSARPDGSKPDWAYYEFSRGQKSAKAAPDRACYDCHLQHASDDNVWVQFYPTLRKLRAEREASKKGG